MAPTLPARAALLVLLALAPEASGSRPQLALVAEDEAFDADAFINVTAPLERVRALFQKANGVVCGGREIRNLLGSDTPVESVRTLPWSSALAIAREFLKSQAIKIAQLRAEARSMQVAITAAEKSEEPQAITMDQVRTLMNSAFAVEGSFGSMEGARNSECGYLRTKPKTGNRAFQKAEEGFKRAAESLLRGGTIRAREQDVYRFCSQLLPVGNGMDLANGYCSELCHSFADNAARSSGSVLEANVVNGTSSADLKKKLAEKTADVAEAERERAECDTARGDLQGFRQQLEGMENTVKQEHEKLRLANDEVNDQREKLEQLQKELQQRGQQVTDAEKAVQEKREQERAVRNEFQGRNATFATEQRKLQEAQGSLTKADAAVKNLQDAQIAGKAFRDALSTVLRQMHLYMERAVREPLRNLGVSESLDISKAFPEPTKLPQSDATKKSLQDLQTLCSDATTQRAFRALNSTELPASSLCEFGNVQEVGKEIDSTVEARVRAVAQDLKEAQNWLNVYHGQDGMTAERSSRLREQGEPHGLREVIGAFQQTDFYRSYLAHWRVAEKYHALLLRLEEDQKKKEQERTTLRSLVASLQLDNEKAEKDKDKSAERLAAAVDEVKRAEADKASAEVELQTVRSRQAAATSRLRDLEEAANAAKARWSAALKALQDTHRSGVGLVQLFQELGRSAVAAAAAAAR